MLKIAVFDLDGTLTDSIEDLADATNYGLEQLGFPAHDYEEYKHFVGNGAKKLCFRALPQDEKEYTEELHRLFREYYGKHYLDKTRLYDGIGAVLGELQKNGVILAVATNKPQDFAVKIINALLPEINFVKVLGGCEDRPKKPDPAVIKEILADIPDCGEVFMTGDSDVDIMTAKNAGIASIGCEWGFRGRSELENAGADRIAAVPSDILKYILR